MFRQTAGRLKRVALFTILTMVLWGCDATHSDSLSTFIVSGTIETIKYAPSEFGKIGTPILVELTDINLDDARRPDQRTIFKERARVGKPFYIKKGYFWGASEKHPYEEAMVSLIIRAEGCEEWRSQYKIKEILNSETYDLFIDIGRIMLNC